MGPFGEKSKFCKECIYFYVLFYSSHLNVINCRVFMCMRSEKFVNMSRSSRNSSPQGVHAPQNNTPNLEQLIEMTVNGTGTSTIIEITASIVSQTTVSTTTPEIFIPQWMLYPLSIHT